MKTISSNRIKLIGLLILVLLAPVSAAAQTEFDRIVVFGTSVSDSGNGFALNKIVNTPPKYKVDPLLVPDAPYPRGGLRLSNGPVWVEQLAEPLGMSQDVRPALRDNNPNSTNYATDGTRAIITATTPPNKTTFSEHVGTFLADFGDVAPSDALYVVEIGSNDVRDALVNPENPFILFGTATFEVGNNIVDLFLAGARKFLVLNVPPIGFTPAVRNLGPAAIEGANLLSGLYNIFLEITLQTIENTTGFETIEIIRVDVNMLVTDIITSSDPFTEFGLTEVEVACIEPDDPTSEPVTPPFICENPDEYFFWDGIHPTEAAHAFLAAEAASELEL